MGASADTTAHVLAPLAIGVPLAVATLLAAIRPIVPRRLADLVAIAAAVASAVLAAGTLWCTGGAPAVIWLGGWEPVDGIAIGTSLVIDGIGAGTALFAAVLGVGALVFSTRYLKTTGGLFHTLMLIFVAAMIGFAYTGDLFSLFVFFELVTITAFVLVGYQTDQRASVEGALSFAIVNVLASFFFLLGVGLIYRRTGTLNLAGIGRVLTTRPPDALVTVSFGLIAAGLFTKAAIVPFHFWLADAYAVARTPVCIMLAGIMSELGLYGVARVYWSTYSGVFAPAAGSLRMILVVFGVATAVVGLVMAWQQTNLKRLLAFVVICHLGLYLIGVGLLDDVALGGTALYALGDGLVIAVLFIAVGVVERRRSHVDARRLHGRAGDQPFTAALFVVGALALAGAPPFASFTGKSLVEHGAVATGQVWSVVVIIGVTVGIGAVLLRAAGWVFAGRGQPRDAGATDESGDEPENGQPGFPWTMWTTGAVFAALSLTIGSLPGIAERFVHAASRFVDRSGYAAAVIDGGTWSSRVPPTAVPAIAWYDWLFAAGSVGGAVVVSLMALHLEEHPAPPGRARTEWRRGVEAVRALHAGRIGDHVTFVVTGAALLTGACTVALVGR